MINFKNALREFKKYLQNYDLKVGMIALKVRHTYGVISASEYIAKGLDLDEENIELAKLIALLHDIARFEQAKEFGDYRDYKTLDHVELAVKILFEDNLIRTFIDDNKYDEIILKVIKNHNKLYIEDGLNETELLHAMIIRDADKLDNFRVKSNETFEDIANLSKEELENGTITDKIYNDFMNNKLIISKERKTQIDCWISYLAFIFDLNFNVSLVYIKENNYINILVDRIDYKVTDTKIKMENIRKHAIDYIDNKIKN